MSSMRIVLVDLVGAVLFSGESLRVVEPEVAAVDSSIPTEPEIEPCPETMRSADSGIFPSATPSGTKRAPVAVEEADAQPAAGTTHDPRAA
jgi:hypothetical protein